MHTEAYHRIFLSKSAFNEVSETSFRCNPQGRTPTETNPARCTIVENPLVQRVSDYMRFALTSNAINRTFAHLFIYSSCSSDRRILGFRGGCATRMRIKLLKSESESGRTSRKPPGKATSQSRSTQQPIITSKCAAARLQDRLAQLRS